MLSLLQSQMLRRHPPKSKEFDLGRLLLRELMFRRKVVAMDVLGMYLLQRVSNELTIQKYGSFENQFITPVPDNAAAKVAHEGYISSSKGVLPRVGKGDY